MGDEEKLKILIEAKNNAKKAFDEASEQLKKLRDNHKSTTDKMEASSDKLKSIGGKMSMYVTLPLALLGKSMFSAAADFEQLQIAMETMLGSADKAKTLLSDLDRLASKTPFQISEVQDAARQMLAYGIEADKVVDTTRMLGDVSAGLGTKTFPQLTLTYGQIKAKGKLMGQELLQLTNAGFNLAEAMGVSRGELMEMMETGDGVTFAQVEEAFKNATGEGGRFHDMMKNQSETTAGKISNMQDKITLLKREMGKNLLPVAIEVVGVVNRIAKAFGNLSSGQQKAIVYLGLFAAAAGPVLRVVGSLISGIKGIAKATKATVTGLKAVGSASASAFSKSVSAGKTAISTTKQLASATAKYGKSVVTNTKYAIQYRAWLVKENALKAAAKVKTVALAVAEKARMVVTKIATGVQAAFNAVMAMNPIFLIVIAVVALIAVMVLLYKKNETVRDLINKAWESISSSFMTALDVFKAVWNGIVAVIKWAWDSVIKPVWDIIVWYISNILIPYYKMLWTVIQTVWNAIVSVIKWAWENVIKPIWDLIYWYVTNVLIPVWTKIFEVAKAAWDGIYAAIQSAWNFIKAILEAVWGYIVNTLIPTFQKIWEKVSDVFTKVWNKIGEVKSNIISAFNTVKDAISTLIDKFTGIKDKVSTAFGNVADGITKPFKSAFNTIIDLYNKSLGKIDVKLPDWLGGKSFSMPKIDKLYKGVRNFGGGMAVVGDINGRGGEIVNMPGGTDVYNNAESKRIMRAIADGSFTPNGNGGGTANTFTGDIYLMNADAVKEFFKQLDRQGELSAMGVPA